MCSGHRHAQRNAEFYSVFSQVSEGSVAVTKNRRKQGLPPKFRDCYLDYQSDDESDGETFSESEDEAQRVTSGDAEHVIKQEPISDEESSFTEDNKQEDHEAKTKFTLDNVQVKEEPFNLIINDDCGAKASDPSSSPEPDKMVQSQSISKPKSRRRQASNFSVPVNESQVSGSDIPVKTGPAQSGKAAARAGSGTSGSTINSVVDLLSLRCELSVAQSRNAELETRLDDARSEIARLSDVVSTRETQIKNLANSFFDLSERFMSAAAEFKRVVHSVNQGDNQ